VTRQIYIVTAEDQPQLTVIAESEEDAQILAAAFWDTEVHELEDLATAEDTQWGLRWVGFTTANEAEQQIRDLENRGVGLHKITRRISEKPGDGPYLWEVGTRDDCWVRLPEGVLCGGEE
jgi:hypothetical protein